MSALWFELPAVCANGIVCRRGGRCGLSSVLVVGSLNEQFCVWSGFVSVVSEDRVALLLLDLARL